MLVLGLAVQPVRGEMPVLFDNVFLTTGAGVERLPGEDRTGYGIFGANWGIPLTPPSDVALGLQLGGDLKLRENDPEWNATVGAFGRHFQTFGEQRGAAAVLFDYRRTAFHEDLWAVRPILGTTISARDELGVEGSASLKETDRRSPINSLRTFWTRQWSDRFGTEFGAGYELRRVKGALFRARAAIRLTPFTDLWCGGDANLNGNYAVGIGVSYRLGGTGRHASLNSIGGTGDELYTPFPTADYPSLLIRKK